MDFSARVSLVKKGEDWRRLGIQQRGQGNCRCKMRARMNKGEIEEEIDSNLLQEEEPIGPVTDYMGRGFYYDLLAFGLN